MSSKSIIIILSYRAYYFKVGAFFETECIAYSVTVANSNYGVERGWSEADYFAA